MKKIFYLLVFILLTNKVFAQNDKDYLGTWNILNLRLGLVGKWSVFGEAQIRSLRLYNHFHYHEIKGGLEYRLNPSVAFVLAMGDYNTYQSGGNFIEPKPSAEIRVWQQITLSQKIGRLRLEHRYRAEQRFQPKGLRNRFRYRASMIIPLNNLDLLPKTWYINVSNEIFFTDVPTFFERNRFFVGFGHKFSQTFTLQSGFLHQFDYKIPDEIGYNFMQISALFDLKLKKPKESM